MFCKLSYHFVFFWCPIIWQFSKQQIEACGTLARTKPIESEALRAAFGAFSCTQPWKVKYVELLHAQMPGNCTIYGALHAQNLENRKILEIEARWVPACANSHEIAAFLALACTKPWKLKHFEPLHAENPGNWSMLSPWKLQHFAPLHSPQDPWKLQNFWALVCTTFTALEPLHASNGNDSISSPCIHCIYKILWFTSFRALAYTKFLDFTRNLSKFRVISRIRLICRARVLCAQTCATSWECRLRKPWPFP